MAHRMSTEAYREALGQLGLTQEEVGDLLGFTGRNARRYATGETPVPGAVATMIALWLQRPELIGVVRSLKWGNPNEDPEHERGDVQDARNPRIKRRAA